MTQSKQEIKATNPKDAIGITKVPLHMLSPVAKAHWALAQFVGNAKYGLVNWRAAPVRSSVYLAAMQRHMDAFLAGEAFDPVDGSHHLGNVMACCAILLDAEVAGTLIDDRPMFVDIRPTYVMVEEQMKTIAEKYKGVNPVHYTEDPALRGT